MSRDVQPAVATRHNLVDVDTSDGRFRDVNTSPQTLPKRTQLIGMLTGFTVVTVATPALIGAAFTANPILALAISPTLLIAVVVNRLLAGREFVEGRLEVTERDTRI